MLIEIVCQFITIGCTEKLQITNPPSPQSLGLLFFSCQQKLSAIMQKWKNGCQFITIGHTEKLQMTNPPPPKFGSALLLMLMEIVCHYTHLVPLIPTLCPLYPPCTLIPTLYPCTHIIPLISTSYPLYLPHTHIISLIPTSYQTHTLVPTSYPLYPPFTPHIHRIPTSYHFYPPCILMPTS